MVKLFLCLFFFRENISRQSLVVLSVFDSFGGAFAYTRHTVGAVFSPYRLSVFKPNIIQRTSLGTFTAGDTRVGNIKFLRVNKNWIEKGVDNSAVHFISEGNLRLRDVIVIFNMQYDAVYCAFCLFNNL